MKRTLFILLPALVIMRMQRQKYIYNKGIVKKDTEKIYYTLTGSNVNTPVFIDSSKIKKNGISVLK